MTPEEIAAWEPFLSRIPPFTGLAPEDVKRVTARMQRLSLPKGSTLFSQGDEPNAFYIIASGQLRIVHSLGDAERVVAFLGRGEAVGEGSLLTGELRSTSARLDTTCEFLKLSREDFEVVLRENPAILMHLSRIMARRLVAQRAPAPDKRTEVAQLVTLNSALPRPDRMLLSVHLGLQLVEQTRKRVLLVDMHPDSGAVARSLGLKPLLLTEADIREANLRDPAVIRALAQQHPSGLDILNVPAATFGGRLYSGIYLFLNFLREAHAVILARLGNEFGDVEKSIIAEADKVLLAGTDEWRPQFRQLEAEMRGLVPDDKKLLQVWLGDPDPEDGILTPGVERIILPWSGDLGEKFEASGSPFLALADDSRSLRGVERLARRIGGIKVGLALGTGAALGHSLIGVLKVLKREHIPIDIIAGTSIGSIIAGFTALGMEPEEIEEIALRVDKAWLYENLFWDLTLPRSGFFSGQTLLRFLRSYFGSREFSDLELPYACVAADIETGEEVVLKEGRVAEAVRASCGLPLIFSPIHWNGRYLVDGGLVNPVPTRVIADMGADVTIAVNLTMPASDRRTRLKRSRMKGGSFLETPVDLSSLRELAFPEVLKSPHMLSVFFQMIYTMEYEIAQSRVDMAHVAIHPDLTGFSWTEMHRAKELIKVGERSAEQYIPQIKALVPFFSSYCKIPQRPFSHWKP